MNTDMATMGEGFEPEAESVATPPTNFLAPLDKAITSLPASAPTESLLQVREELLFYKQESQRMLGLVESMLVDRINASGPVEYGNGIRFYLSHPKTTKCADLKATIEALGAATGGDEALFIGCFSANAIKYGQAKRHLTPEQFDKLFTVTVKDKLEDGSPAPKKLTKADTKWMK